MSLALIPLTFPDFHFAGLFLLLILGFILLIYGGDLLTAGAAAISTNLKIDPVIVGLTVVSIATSMPEMATSLMAARDNPGIALGNILGSNLANIGLIMGIAGIISPLRIDSPLIHSEVRIMIGVTLLFSLFALGDGFNRIEGLILLSLTAVYLIYLVRRRNELSAADTPESINGEAEAFEQKTNGTAAAFIVIGGTLLALGAEILVGSSAEIAIRLGASDLFIGMTIVAIGTSVPELAATLAAIRAGYADMCVGNIVGSNLFNILLVGGGVAGFTPIYVDRSLLLIEFPALIFLSILLLLFVKSGCTIKRQSGVFLLFLYTLILSVSALSQFGYLF